MTDPSPKVTEADREAMREARSHACTCNQGFYEPVIDCEDCLALAFAKRREQAVNALERRLAKACYGREAGEPKCVALLALEEAETEQLKAVAAMHLQTIECARVAAAQRDRLVALLRTHVRYTAAFDDDCRECWCDDWPDIHEEHEPFCATARAILAEIGGGE